MKKIGFFFSFIVLVSSSFAAYYYPNADIQKYLDDVNNNFVQIISYVQSDQGSIPASLFANLANDFAVLKNKLPQTNPQFRVIYENCYLTSKKLANGFNRADFDTFNAQCFGPWKQLTRELNSKYTVHAKIKAYPQSGNAPLTVTFDARGSYDPSADTIPTNNYYWYYKDSNGVERLMGQGPVIKYTFNSPNTYIVHLTVRSANKASLGILDGEATTSISVAPPIAKIVLYINGVKANSDSYVKISTQEAKQGVLFDASSTVPQGATKIVSSTWIIKDGNRVVFKKTIPDYPGAVRVKLPNKGFYFITLILKDNTGKTVSKTFKLVVSNPVAIIKVTPPSGTTSTKFFIDGSASYSVEGNIISYKWTISDPQGNIIDQFQNKKSFTYQFHIPGTYSIKLEITDSLGNKNNASYKLNVQSTPPVANFVYKAYDNWGKPSTFIFDASYSYDVDTKYGDSLSYYWTFSNSNNVKVQKINNGKQIIAQFNKKGEYKVTLTVKDKYGKTSSITKPIKILSTLRPQVFLNPEYVRLGEPLTITVKANKPILYYEYYFGDGKYLKTDKSQVSHTYMKAGIFPLKVVAYSADGDSNWITKQVFVGQRNYPMAIYKVLVNNNELEPNTYCKKDDCNGSGCEFVPAYSIDRLKTFVIDASNSVNSQGSKQFLKIYFQVPDQDAYQITSRLTYKFDELGCKKIVLYVKDLNTNKVDAQAIYFKVKDALPLLKDLKMYFPQYGGAQQGAFRPNIGGSTLPKDIFSPGFDPLLVKLRAVGAYDPDSPMLSYYRWYYYKKGDKTNLLDVKITPYNIPEIVFSLPRIPGAYIFGVDVCDVDGKCTNSEQYLHLKPMVDIPPSTSNPYIPQVNSVRIDANGVKGVGEVNVGEKVTVHVDATVLSNNPDFYTSRTIKYDFDNDGKWDLTTKKDTVEHIYTKPGKYRVKVKVIYRGYGGIGYSAPLIVKKGLKPLLDINVKGQDLIFNDLSFGNIEKRKFCFNIKNCKKNPNYMFINETYGHVFYPTTGLKLAIFEWKDKYGNEKILKKKIKITDLSGSYLLTLPKSQKDGLNYKLVVAGMYSDYFLLYYKSDNSNCYIDKNVTVDTDNNKNPTDDRDLLCNKLYKLEYPATSSVILLIHDGNTKHKLEVTFANYQVSIPEKLKPTYETIQQLIYKYSSSNNEIQLQLVKILSDLLNNLTDKIDRDSILLSLNDFISSHSNAFSKEDINKIKSIIANLQDVALSAAINNQTNDVFSNVKNDILTLLASDENKQELEDLFNKLAQTSSKDQRKQILQQILNIAVKEKEKGNIDDETLVVIKQDICELLKYYEIPSKACGTATNVQVQNTENGSLFSKILKVVLYILAAVAGLFIILIVVFVIKAKKRREQLSKEESNE